VSAAGERAAAQGAAADHAVVPPPPGPEPEVHPAARQCPLQRGAALGRVV
jgi:hypothetical protein